jgi:hypothetical protein
VRNVFNRRVGIVGSAIIVGLGFALTVAVAQLLPEKKRPQPAKATPTASAVACTPQDPPYGAVPEGFAYAPVADAARKQTVKALDLDEAAGRVDVRQAQERASGAVYGRIVGVPSKNPIDYAARLVASAQASGTKVERAAGYAFIPLESGTQVAVGVKGCRTVLISGQDRAATRSLAAAVFSG